MAAKQIVTEAVQHLDNDHGPRFEVGSFRDRTGRIISFQGNIYRLLSREGDEAFRALQGTHFYRKRVQDGSLIATDYANDVNVSDLTNEQCWVSVLSHRKIPFISYPYEWSFEMLKDAAILQLDLMEDALNEDMILKDATPFNVQFIGARPVFIDILSFEPLKPGQVWYGYKQFCELYLYPLMLQAYKKIPFHPFLRGSLEGFSPEVFSNLMSFRDLFRPGVFKHVYLHSKLQSSFADSNKDIKGAVATSGFHKEMILANVQGLKKIVRNLQVAVKKTEWSDYAVTCVSYEKEVLEQKIDWINTILKTRKWSLIWDIGCNTGTFSALASNHAEYVLGSDIDWLAIDRLYKSEKVRGEGNILPLIADISNLSPSLGWRGLERKRMESRGKPCLVLALALVHHVVITANVPLEEFLYELSKLGKSVVVEFVTREDPMVRKLLLNKVDQYKDYSQENFERCFNDHFVSGNKLKLNSGTRVLYYGQSRISI